MAGLRDCPVCGCSRPVASVRRAAIPVFQNVTYATAEAARAAPRAEFVLATCAACGFSYNGAFDPDRVTYDESYDNHVASAAFHDYYRQLARMMIARFGLADGRVYDIGCGKGEFLEVLHSLAPTLQAIGIDPSCTPREEENLRLVRARFEASLLAGEARLVILRHVLEHIDRPVDFLRQLHAAMPDAPLFVEVPDLDWILENGAFWDFCYEHCNYFTESSLAAALGEAGFVVEEQQRAFGDQYRWAICRRGTPAARTGNADAELAKLAAYGRNEAERIAGVAGLGAHESGLILWGMATKGVMLASLLPGGLVIGGVDLNAAKQGRFVAGSGVEIHPPDWLRSQSPKSRLLVMNPNYAEEISTMVAGMGIPMRPRTIESADAFPR